MTVRVPVTELNVPPPTYGEDRAGAALARTGPAGRQYPATVLELRASGQARVLIEGHAKTASVRATAKNVRAGDKVLVTKVGGRWEVVAVTSWHDPAPAPTPPSITPSTVSGSTGTVFPTMTSIGSDGITVRGDAGADTDIAGAIKAINENRATLRQIHDFVLLIRTRLNLYYADAVNDHSDAIRSLDRRVSALESQGNANRALATGLRDTVKSTHDALKGENILR